MKKLINAIVVLTFSLAVFFTSCKKDDNNPKNQMTYNTIEYELSQGILENYGSLEGESVYNFDIILLSPGLTTHEIDGVVDSVSGTGNAIMFEFMSGDSTKLISGNYVFSENETNTAGTFIYSTMILNYDSETDMGDEYIIAGGNIKVENNNSEYVLTFDFTLENGKQMSGYYKGSLKYYDFTTLYTRSISPAKHILFK